MNYIYNCHLYKYENESSKFSYIPHYFGFAIDFKKMKFLRYLKWNSTNWNHCKGNFSNKNKTFIYERKKDHDNKEKKS